MQTKKFKEPRSFCDAKPMQQITYLLTTFSLGQINV